MDPSAERQLRHYAKFAYPMHVVATGDQFRASHPDLPGCCVVAPLPQLYTELEAARMLWLRRCILAGDLVPRPNSHTRPAARRTVRLEPMA